MSWMTKKKKDKFVPPHAPQRVADHDLEALILMLLEKAVHILDLQIRLQTINPRQHLGVVTVPDLDLRMIAVNEAVLGLNQGLIEGDDAQDPDQALTQDLVSSMVEEAEGEDSFVALAAARGVEDSEVVISRLIDLDIAEVVHDLEIEVGREVRLFHLEKVM